jgi:hypothetical protein
VIRRRRKVQTRNVAATQEFGCAHCQFLISGQNPGQATLLLVETCPRALTCLDHLDGPHLPLRLRQTWKAHSILSDYRFPSFPLPSTTHILPSTIGPIASSSSIASLQSKTPKGQLPDLHTLKTLPPSPLRIFALFFVSPLLSSLISSQTTYSRNFAVAETPWSLYCNLQPKRRQQFTLVWWHSFFR